MFTRARIVNPATPHGGNDAKGALVVPAVVFLASRALLFVLARIAPDLLTPLHNNQTALPRADPLAKIWDWSSPWFRFDARWYVDIAEHGYRYGAVRVTNTNFFPLYPLLIRAVQPLTFGSAWFAAWLVANAAFLGALILLWRWAVLRWDSQTALRVLVLTTCFPFAFFFAAPYAESLFLALAVATFLFAERERWYLATCAAALSSITRPVGAAVVLGLIVIALSRSNRRAALLSCAGFLPLLAFIMYVTVSFGQPLGFLTYHSAGWVPPHGDVMTTLTSQFHTNLSPVDRVDAAMVALFLASGVLVWRRLGPGYGVYVVVGVLLPLVHGLVSMERYVIVLFPGMAVWANWQSKLGQAAMFGASLLLLVLATCMFAVGYAIF